jgi:hypothetical protein
MQERRSRRRVEYHPRAPRAEPISPSGAIGAYTTGGCLLLAGIVFTIAAAIVVSCVIRCAIPPPFGGLALFVSVPVAVAGAAILRTVVRRPVDPDGASGWVWGVAFVFIVGVALAATMIPSHTCPPGVHLDSDFALCIEDGGNRYDATSWIWLKFAVGLAGVAVGILLGRWERAARVTAPIATLAWAVGFAWLLADTLGMGLLR